MTFNGGTGSFESFKHSLEFYSNFSPEGVGSRVSYHCALLELFLSLKSTKFVIIIFNTYVLQDSCNLEEDNRAVGAEGSTPSGGDRVLLTN